MSTYPQKTSYSATKSTLVPSVVLNTGIFGTIVGAATTLGTSIHKVQTEEIEMKTAISDSLIKGASVGIATATAVAAVQTIGGSRLTNWVVLAATATGVGYAINIMGNKDKTETKTKVKTKK